MLDPDHLPLPPVNQPPAENLPAKAPAVEPQAVRSASQRTWTVVKIVVSSILLILVLTQVEWQVFFQILGSISFTYMLFPLVGYYVNMGLSVIKWHTLLEYLKITDRFTRLYTIYLTGAFYNNFLPSTIGGDGYRFLEMRTNHPGKSEEIFSSILLERGFGYLALLIFNLVLALYYRNLIISQTWLLVIEVGLAMGLLALGLLWVFRYRVIAFAKKLEQQYNHPSFHRWNLAGKLERLLKMLEIKNARVLWISLGTSFLFVLIGGIWLGVYYWSVGEQVNWLYAIYVSTLVNIVGALPITLNGLGIVEFIQVRLMGLVGVPVETVLVVSLMTRAVLIFLSLPGGLFSFRWK